MKLKILLLILFIAVTPVLAKNIEKKINFEEIWSSIEQNRFNEVENKLNKVLKYKNKEEMYEVYYNIIREIIEDNEYEVALKFINKFIEEYPKYKQEDLYWEKSLILKDLYRYKESIKSWKNYLNKFESPFFETSAKLNLGELYFKHQKYKKAYKNLNWCIKENVNFPTDYVPATLNLIDVYFAWGKLDKAKELIDEGIQEYKEKEDYKKYYLKYRIKLAKYYFIQKNWEEYEKVNELPLSFIQKIWWKNSTMAIKLKKLNEVYKYRENSAFVDCYINYFLHIPQNVLNIEIQTNRLKKKWRFLSGKEEGKLAVLTMKGVSHFWLKKNQQAKEYLLQAYNKNNFLFDDTAYYLARIEFEAKNYKQAKEYIESVGKTDLWKEMQLLMTHINVKLERETN